jgi:hypothetical protein
MDVILFLWQATCLQSMARERIENVCSPQSRLRSRLWSTRRNCSRSQNFMPFALKACRYPAEKHCMSPIEKFTMSITAVVILLTANNQPRRSFAAEPGVPTHCARPLIGSLTSRREIGTCLMWAARFRSSKLTSRQTSSGSLTGNSEVMTASEVKSHSSIDRLLVVFHSPSGMAETGLLACPSEKTERMSRYPLTRRTSLVRFGNENYRIGGDLARFQAITRRTSLHFRLCGGEIGIRTLVTLLSR